MNTIARVILGAVLALGFGCAKPDWIQQTLMTVDVTGVWIGSLGKALISTEVRLELEQQGSKVTGKFLPLTGHVLGGGFEFRPGPLEGTVSGEVFSFKVTNGSITGEMTVNGDEMQKLYDCRWSKLYRSSACRIYSPLLTAVSPPHLPHDGGG
jgi:hypothetical protein